MFMLVMLMKILVEALVNSVYGFVWFLEDPSLFSLPWSFN